MGLLTKLFGTRSEREVKRIMPTVAQILALEDQYKAMPEEELKAKTAQHTYAGILFRHKAVIL